MSRCFIALELDPKTLAVAAEAQRAIDALGARKTKPESLHITIKFLGDDVSPDAARVVLASVGELVEAVAAPSFGSAHLDAFPSPARGKIVVLACQDPSATIAAIAKRAEDAAFDRAAIQREERAFRPHVTLARSRTPVDVRKIAKSFGERPCGQATRVVLFESELGPTGPRYTELGAHAFA